MKSYDLASLLFQPVGTLKIGDDEYKINTSAPQLTKSDAARVKAKSYGKSIKEGSAPKYSSLLYGIKALLENRIQIGRLDNNVIISTVGNAWYSILTNVTGGQHAYNIFHTIEGDERPQFDEMVGVTLVALILTRKEIEKKQDWMITFQFLSQLCRMRSEANSIIGGVCDSFYYETIAMDASFNLESSASKVNEFVDKAELCSRMECGNLSDVTILTVPQMTGASTLQEEFVKECEEVRNGAFYVKYPFTDHEDAEVLSRIPDMSIFDRYVMNRPFLDALYILSGKLSVINDRIQHGVNNQQALAGQRLNMKLIGVPGTGKSICARALAAALGLPLYTVTCSAHTEEDTFTGKTLPADGGLKQYPTEFLNAFRYGGVVVLEEVNLLNPGVAMSLSQSLEEPYILFKDGVELIHRHPMCVVIAAYNPNLNGTNDQNDAFLNRFPYTLEIEPPSECEQIEIIKKAAGVDGKDADRVVNAMYNVYSDVMSYLLDPHNDAKHCATLLSYTRNCVESVQNFFFLRRGKPVGNNVCVDEFRKVARSCFISEIKARDEEVGENLEKTIVPKLENGLKYSRIKKAASSR